MATTTTSPKKILPTHSSLMEQFPDMLPNTNTMFKKWVWKEDTNTLEQINTGFQISHDKQFLPFINKSKKSGKIGRRMTLTQSTQRKVTLKANDFKSVAVSPKPSMKLNPSDKRSVTLNDVKGVAIYLLSDNVSNLPENFKESYRNNHFDGFLIATLYYFKMFFEKLSLDGKSNTLSMQPSVTEKKASLADVKMEAAKKLLSEKYCSLILGIDSKDHHHLGRGSLRKSFTNRDRRFYEALYSFCCLLVWITFRRTHLEDIQSELGRLFRSDAFNPYRDSTNQAEFKLAYGLTSKDIHDVKLASISVGKNKRPPISSIINQRSPVLVALFPTSKDSSAQLLDRRKPIGTSVRADRLQVENTVSEKNEDLEKLNVGIIGEMLSGFNPLTLAPFGDDGEDEDEEEDSEEEGEQPGGERLQQSMKQESDGEYQMMEPSDDMKLQHTTLN